MAQVCEYGYEYDAVLQEQLWTQAQDRCVKQEGMPLLLRSGRDALKVIAREYKAATALLPALACDSMVLPFEMYGHQIRYYRLNEDYHIALEDLRSSLDNTDGIILFLYMNYFGKPVMFDGELWELKRQYPNVIFIEDRTHDLIQTSGYDFPPDYMVASLRKWANVPDGGLLWTNRELQHSDYSEDLSFSQKRLRAQCMRRAYFLSGDASIKTTYRGIFSTVSDLIDEDRLPGRMSEYAYRLAAGLDWKTIRMRRYENARVLLEILKPIKGIQIIQEDLERSNLYLPILLEHRDEVQRNLSAKGIFCTLIWPLSEKQKVHCAISKYTEEHMLGIPCDQRYSVEDMMYIGSEIAAEIERSQQ